MTVQLPNGGGATPDDLDTIGWQTGQALSVLGDAPRPGLSLRKGLVDHETTAIRRACGDAVLTRATLTNANGLVIVAVR
jgi:hypothetical protein